jgi:hypothetical protein
MIIEGEFLATPLAQESVGITWQANALPVTPIPNGINIELLLPPSLDSK